jgi:hypothetical protein
MDMCPYCFENHESGYDHLYRCPVLNERIKSIHPKRGTRKSRPLHSLTHEGEQGVGRPALCNCENCIKLDEENILV